MKPTRTSEWTEKDKQELQEASPDVETYNEKSIEFRLGKRIVVSELGKRVEEVLEPVAGMIQTKGFTLKAKSTPIGSVLILEVFMEEPDI